MEINSLIKILEDKLKKNFTINNLKIEDKSFLHKKHKNFSKDKFYIMLTIESLELKKMSSLEANRKIGKSYNKHPAANVYINEDMINKMLPLLKSQNFINHVHFYNNNKIDIDLNLFREIYTEMNMASTRWYFHITGVHADLSLPYLLVNPHKNIKNKVVLIRSNRRNNVLISYSFLKKYDNLLFIGLSSEYEELKKQIPNLKFYNCNNFLEMAEIIKASKFFLGNITFGYCIAEALKVPRLLECSHDGDLAAVHPSGKNSYEFFFQEHFEKWFDCLYKL